MKTIPVCVIVASFLSSSMGFAQPGDGTREKGKPRDGGKGGFEGGKAFFEAADSDKDGLISFAEFEALPRVANLPPDRKTSLFERLDHSGDGKLGRDELFRFGKPQPGRPMQRLWELDTDKNGSVSFQEFQAGKISARLPVAKQEGLFRRLDTNGDGVISPLDRPDQNDRPDFFPGGKRKPDKPDGKKGQKPDAQQMIRLLDQDGDGALSFEEFRQGPRVRELGEDEQEDRFMELDKNDDMKITKDDFSTGGDGME